MSAHPSPRSAERERLRDPIPWRRLGTYMAEREWGVPREDYGDDGEVWKAAPHESARFQAWRWSEDGLFGFSDDRNLLCLSFALWNGKDSILKERLFGLANEEGNHGEDVKEVFYYLDNLPSHAYARALYKYPQAAFPYDDLIAENARRSRKEREYELQDTGVFDEDRFFDVTVEYAKASPDDVLMRLRVKNRGPEAADIHVLPQVWFRNTWSWAGEEDPPKPELRREEDGLLVAEHPDLPRMRLEFEPDREVLFCENETNLRCFREDGDIPGAFKDAIHEHVVRGTAGAVHDRPSGTKAAIHHVHRVEPGEEIVVRVRLSAEGERSTPAFEGFDDVFRERLREADEFYDELLPAGSADERAIQREAYAGLLWSKQFYHYYVGQWLRRDPVHAPPPGHAAVRNTEWAHARHEDIIAVPDPFEYPWYAAWDLAFHCIPLARLDPAFAKDQIQVLLGSDRMHPSGILPAYEWDLGDTNPPLHAWAALRVFEIERELEGGPGDLGFLRRVFDALHENFTALHNRYVEDFRVYIGFLGADNAGLFDRSTLPEGVRLHQADGSAWMARFALSMMRIALALGPDSAPAACRYLDHFVHFALSATRPGEDALWNDEDGFFYDLVIEADGTKKPVRVVSVIGLTALFAVEVIAAEELAACPELAARFEELKALHPELADRLPSWSDAPAGGPRLLALMNEERLRRMLARVLDERELLGAFGIRSLSRRLEGAPYALTVGDQPYEIEYAAGEAEVPMFGGNSSWRGPVWFPTNHLVLEALRTLHAFHGDGLRVDYPTGSGAKRNLAEVANDLARRLRRIFLRDENGRRPVFHDDEVLQRPGFVEHPLFFEYFDPETGRGCGAAHQTGWTALVTELFR